MREKKKETNVSLEMTDEQFLVEIEEYAQKLLEDNNHNEYRGTPDSEEDEHELEITKLLMI